MNTDEYFEIQERIHKMSADQKNKMLLEKALSLPRDPTIIYLLISQGANPDAKISYKGKKRPLIEHIRTRRDEAKSNLSYKLFSKMYEMLLHPQMPDLPNYEYYKRQFDEDIQSRDNNHSTNPRNNDMTQSEITTLLKNQAQLLKQLEAQRLIIQALIRNQEAMNYKLNAFTMLVEEVGKIIIKSTSSPIYHQEALASWQNKVSIIRDQANRPPRS